MKRFFNLFLILVPFSLLNCSGGNNEQTASEDHELEELNELIADLEATEVPEDADFTIEIPEYMFPADNLNPEAEAQYAFVEEEKLDNGESKVWENYVIVMMETKEEIKNYPVDMNWDAMSYCDNVMESLREGVDKFIITTETPKVEQVNGMDCVKNEMVGTLETRKGAIELFYKLGVFEGERAFYQVLTWCLGDQKDRFEGDMDRMINSFEENN